MRAVKEVKVVKVVKVIPAVSSRENSGVEAFGMKTRKKRFPNYLTNLY
jgi:hypothetical protein